LPKFIEFVSWQTSFENYALVNWSEHTQKSFITIAKFIEFFSLQTSFWKLCVNNLKWIYTKSVITNAQVCGIFLADWWTFESFELVN
jgi:hypothetical protein